MSHKWGNPGYFSEGKDYGKIIARYVHEGNKVIQPTALDTTTGIYTCAESLNTLLGANGTAYQLVPVPHNWGTNIIPREIKASEPHRLEIISDNTFYIQGGTSGTTRFTSYPNALNPTDHSNYHFEVPIAPSGVTIDLSSYDLKGLLMRAMGVRNRAGQSYFRLQGNHDGGTYNFYPGSILDGKDFMTHFAEIYWRYDDETDILFGQAIRTAQQDWNDANGGWTTLGQDSSNIRVFEKFSNLKITGIQAQFAVANGYTIEIFDTRGSS